jgi:hypothetical protein
VPAPAQTWALDDISLTVKPGQLAALWVRVFRSLDAIVGSNDAAARAWLTSANAAFGGARPIERMRDAEGLVHVLHYLDSARARL